MLSGWKILLERIFKLILVIAIPLLLIRGGLYLYQTPDKTDRIYTEALKSYNSSDFSNAYYLFSRIIFTSNLKPLAIYRQGVAADKLDDIKSAVKQYRLFLLIYPKHVMSIRVRYNLAQDLFKSNPKRAQKDFDYIISHYPNSDYAIASEYYSGLILIKKYEKNKIFPLSAKNDIQTHFRHYLKKAPSGRLAMQVVNDWSGLDADINDEDYLLMAKTCYLFNDFKKAEELSKKADIKTSWAFRAKNAFASGDKTSAVTFLETGIKEKENYADENDIKDAIDAYMSTVPSKYTAALNMFNIAKSAGKDYLMNIRCSYSPTELKSECYKNLYLWFPKSKYVDEALAQIFLLSYKTRNITDTQRIGIDFLNKYKDTSPYAPMVMYYLGRLSENIHAYQDFHSYYKSVISKYPDSYYAYRSYLRLKHNRNPIITNHIKERKIEFPYNRKHAFLDKLLELGDYEILDEYASYDDFVKSWTLYRRGEKSKAMLIARDAMDKLSEKPNRDDLRWRLVYPIFYYNEIKASAGSTGNSIPLIIALIREESYFNPMAQSSAGARGLMQLMNETAGGVASSLGIKNYNLFNPEQNIKLGNTYYSQIKTQLGGNDMYAVASYNGGIGAVSQWRKALDTEDTDVFAEHIPYPETKNYVKKVFRTYWNYVRIYDENY